MSDWQKGVVFIRGINIYKSKRISKKKMLKLCKSIEDENLKIIKIVKTDNIIFEKRKIRYAEISLRIEKVLSDYFNEKVYATSRSMKTIKLLINS
jgi:uncharacterized protein (DUF1697 family)